MFSQCFYGRMQLKKGQRNIRNTLNFIHLKTLNATILKTQQVVKYI